MTREEAAAQRARIALRYQAWLDAERAAKEEMAESDLSLQEIADTLSMEDRKVGKTTVGDWVRSVKADSESSSGSTD